MTDTAPEERNHPPEAAKKKEGRRRKIVMLAIAGAAVAAALAFGLPAWLHSLDHESTDDAFVEGHVVPVSARVPGHTVEVAVDNNQAVKAGDLLVRLDPADRESDVEAAAAALDAARAREEAARLRVDLTEVGTGADLESAEAGVEMAKARVAAAETGVAAAESALAQARVGVKVAQASVDEAEADVTSKEAAAKRDRADLERARRMVENDSAPEQALDHARAAATASDAEVAAAKQHLAAQRARVEQAESAVAVAGSAVDQAKSERESAKASLAAATAKRDAARSGPKEVAAAKAALETATAEVKRAEAAVATAKLLLSYTEIRAPSDGRVTKKSVEEGQYVQPGQALLTIVPPEVWVVANFKETQLGRIRPGQPVKIEVDAWPDHVFPGRVESVQRGTGSRFSLLPPENATGNYVKVVQRVPVKIVFDPAPDLDRFLLVPGMSVVPDVTVSE